MLKLHFKNARFIKIFFQIFLSIFLLTSCQNSHNHRIQWWFNSIECTYNVLAGEGLSIALIDSGVDKNHPDLKHCDIETINLLDEQQKSDMKHGIVPHYYLSQIRRFASDYMRPAKTGRVPE